MAANYDNSAWFYDGLARLVYGKALVKAQVYLLGYIQPNSTILIVGGGTGWILEELTRIYPSHLNITYVEVAANMIARSKKRQVGLNKVTFINEAVENVNLPVTFDVIITPFLFDNFTEQTLQKVFKHLHTVLKPTGVWLNADFQLNGKWWQLLLLNTMFLFFRILCRIEAIRLPEIEKRFQQYGYQLIAEKTFFGDFIISSVYSSKVVNVKTS